MSVRKGSSVSSAIHGIASETNFNRETTLFAYFLSLEISGQFESCLN